ncbi:putative galactose oxidase [Geopyxis carbonaria]|nr:putative galactose oxidase [Geopyxis carbonaria]
MFLLKLFGLVSTILIHGTFANISLDVPSLECTSVDNCLRGQLCVHNLCTLTKGISFDGKCGPKNNGLVCNANSSIYKGACCSSYGWCGETPAHCGPGCTSGPCSTLNTATSSAAISTGEPVISVSSSKPTASGISTKNGSCGKQHGGRTCTGWKKGECCSMYGWCGDTDSHCGDGCQSGPCIAGGSPPAPGPGPAPITNGGRFDIVGRSGVPAMHAGLLANGRVFFLDKVEDKTELKLSNGRYAYSSEYNPVTNKVVPLGYKTNAFCSGGTYLANGDVLALGGNGPLDWLDPTVADGFDGIRYLSRSSSQDRYNGQSWKEPGNKLASKRWYPSAQTLADGRVFVASGSLNGLDPTVQINNNPTYEILSPSGISSGKNIKMEILEKNQPYYMYPFIHLLKDGNIFIFTAKSSQVFDISHGKILKELPDLVGDFRTYPNTGGSVLLPLSSSNDWGSKVMICGGGAYQDVTSPTDPSCGVIAPESADPTWEMDSMPQGRGMVEGTLLPDGTVLWLNGCGRGAQGFELATDPTLRALLYDPTKAKGNRWTQLAASTIPRLYHSVALLLLDGTVLVAGSNPHEMPITTKQPGKPYITEYRVEKFTPPYLVGEKVNLRPKNLEVPKLLKADNSEFGITFDVSTTAKEIKVSLYHGGFVTHSVHMGHRMMFLNYSNWKSGQAKQTISVRSPPNKNVAPPGDYVIYVVADGIPSVGKFVRIQ